MPSNVRLEGIIGRPFAAMIITSTIVMFGLMYLNTYALSHVEFSQTRTWWRFDYLARLPPSSPNIPDHIRPPVPPLLTRIRTGTDLAAGVFDSLSWWESGTSGFISG